MASESPPDHGGTSQRVTAVDPEQRRTLGSWKRKPRIALLSVANAGTCPGAKRRGLIVAPDPSATFRIWTSACRNHREGVPPPSHVAPLFLTLCYLILHINGGKEVHGLAAAVIWEQLALLLPSRLWVQYAIPLVRNLV